MKTALLFPGQGSQKAGMLHELPDHPATTNRRRESNSRMKYRRFAQVFLISPAKLDDTSAPV